MDRNRIRTALRASGRLRGVGLVGTLTGVLTGALVGASVLTACATRASIDGDADAPPRARFSNLFAADGDATVRFSLRHALHRTLDELTRDQRASERPTVVPVDLEAMTAQPFAVAWLGHASLLIRVGERWVLTDPVLGEYATPVPPFGPKRLVPPGLAVEALPHIDAVLISHDHPDHLDLATLRQLAARPGGAPTVFAGQGVAAHVAALGTALTVREFVWWQQESLGDLQLSFVPAHHASGRTPWRRNDTLWGGWMLSRQGVTLYFAGDTAWSAPMFAAIQARFTNIALAALPIGAYLPRPLMQPQHMDPGEAVSAQQMLGATSALAIHWGTFQRGNEAPLEPVQTLRASGASPDRFATLPIGGWMPVVAAPSGQARRPALDVGPAPSAVRAQPASAPALAAAGPSRAVEPAHGWARNPGFP